MPSSPSRTGNALFRPLALTSLFCLISTPAIQANDTVFSNLPDKKTEISINKKVVVVTGRISAGYLIGEADELVYWPAGSDTQLSELNWTMENVFMVGAGITIQPSSWLKFNADISVAANEGSNEMDDFDWMYTTTDWSHWSHHTDVDLTKGSIFDINAELTFFRYHETSFSGLLGYKRDNWEWEARGGEYIYSVNGFRDSIGSFEDDLGITYEQTFDVPYMGLAFQADLSPVFLSGRFIASTFYSATGKDTHHLRDLYFEDEFNNGTMISFDLASAYHFTDHIALMGKYQFTKYYTAHGDTTTTDYSTGEVTVTNGIAGIGNQTSLFSLSFLYMF